MIFNKGAMFGLCRALKKESGRLFLASRQSVDSLETRDSFKTNRGAMFGLDARIALAIFGALSVISGAAMYSAIKEAKEVATITDIQEIGKAVEAFLLDTGVYPTSNTSGEALDGHELLEDPSKDGWAGPYLPYAKTGTRGIDHPTLGTIYITRVKQETWSAYNPTAVLCQKAHTGNCSVFVKIQIINDLNKLKSFETRIDGTATPSDTSDLAGKFRYFYDGTNSSAWFEAFKYDKTQGVN